MTTTTVHEYSVKSGIRPTPKFTEKGLAEYSANVGLRCGHDCAYCSTGASNRCARAFAELGLNAYEFGYAIDADPGSGVSRITGARLTTSLAAFGVTPISTRHAP